MIRARHKRKAKDQSEGGEWKQEKETYVFGDVPGLEVAEVVVRTGGQLQAEFEPEQSIRVLHEIKKSCDLVLNLHQTDRVQIK